MTTTYDPKHPTYLDEADVRAEVTRVFDVCQSCRRCTDLCTVFPTLFDMIDRVDDRDAGGLTPFQQDQANDECFQCKLCAVRCPYLPGHHELAIDFPRLMTRAAGMRHENGHLPVRRKVTDQFVARTDLFGGLLSSASSTANTVLGGEPGSWFRRLTAAITGVSAVRLLPPYAGQRFSRWFERRAGASDRPDRSDRSGRSQGSVLVFPTCLVEYHEPRIGHDLVKVYERNAIACRISSAGCCGVPWLHSGDLQRFTRIAEKNVKTLAAEVRRGTDIVVPQPSCGHVLRRDYVDHVGGPDAELVAEHTYDAAEYLVRVHEAEGTELDTGFDGDVPGTIAYHPPCQLQSRGTGFPGADLMALTGAAVQLVDHRSGTGGSWGLRAENERISIPMAAHLGDAVTRAGGDVVAGDCHLDNTAILEQTGRVPLHPLQVVARAYGIAEETA